MVRCVTCWVRGLLTGRALGSPGVAAAVDSRSVDVAGLAFSTFSCFSCLNVWVLFCSMAIWVSLWGEGWAFPVGL